MPTTTDVRGICVIKSPVIRNLEITNCYGRLAAAFSARGNRPDANWCTYATWASRQAGETIRGEDLLDDVHRRLPEGHWLLHPLQTLWRRLLRRGLRQPETRIGRLTAVLHTPLDAVGLASDAVARGNLGVFAEIGLEFARRLERDDPLDRFIDGLRQGKPVGVVFGAFAGALQCASTQLARQVITDSFMVLSLPDRVLALGTNLTEPLPIVLQEPANEELIALVAQFEPSPPATDDCAARDWSDLHQRMHYISHLFRAFHLDDALARSPFTPEQVECFQRGIVPDGKL